MHIDLRNASQIVQRSHDSAMRGLVFAFTCSEDGRVVSSDENQHLRYLEVVFQRLAINGLEVNPEKC